MSLSEVKAFVFDVFGTCVDWRTSVIKELKQYVKPISSSGTIDYEVLADKWRQQYYTSMQNFAKAQPDVIPDVDAVYRNGLDKILAEIQEEINPINEDMRNELTQVWHRLEPWADTNIGLKKLNSVATTATLSNGTVRLLLDLKKSGGMPFDTIFSAELFQAYKPHPKVYMGAVKLLKLKPQEVCLVAAHKSDLLAAKQQGLKTAFIYRPSEHTEHELDFTDINMNSIENLAEYIIQEKK
ncbi:haloacid dehalogenase, type II [Circinella umbellata]|nr:haloacid dehalogenase, type II [Circinella umbellata]